MLRALHIRNFVLVDEAELTFDAGFTVFSGETGAGKSILIDALALTLGARGDASVVRAGAARAEISAVFDAPESLAATLAELDIDARQDATENATEDATEELVLRRVIDAQGRSRAYVNGVPATLTQLRELGEALVDIHGQHAHQSLLRGDAQRDLLDAHGGHAALRQTLSDHWTRWRALARQWALHNKAELRINTTHGISAGNEVTGRDGLGIDAVAHSAPIAYHWRLYAGGGHAQGRFLEGSGHFNWQRAGAEWRSRDVTIEGELSANSYGHGARTGARLSAIYDLDDHWRIGGDLERLSRNTPLRALRDGVTSDTLGAYLRWRAHERREWWLSLTSAKFSDRNRRFEFDLDGRERVYTGARLKLDALLNLSAQTNSHDAERLYFNPKRAFAVLPALHARHTLHQRYERVWGQEASVSAGAVHQRGYGTGRMLALSYGQRWRASEMFEIGASVRGISRPYDGQREREWQLLIDMNLRF